MTERMTAAELLKSQSKTRKSSARDEDPIHKGILDLLGRVLRSDAVVHHSPNENGMAGDKKSRIIAIAKAKALGMRPGWPDLEIGYGGSMYFLEVKTATGPLSEDQKAVIEDLERAGFKVAVVRSVTEAHEKLKQWGLCRNG